jgi:hypothetical protein
MWTAVHMLLIFAAASCWCEQTGSLTRPGMPLKKCAARAALLLLQHAVIAQTIECCLALLGIHQMNLQPPSLVQ